MSDDKNVVRVDILLTGSARRFPGISRAERRVRLRPIAVRVTSLLIQHARLLARRISRRVSV